METNPEVTPHINNILPTEDEPFNKNRFNRAFDEYINSNKSKRQSKIDKINEASIQIPRNRSIYDKSFTDAILHALRVPFDIMIDIIDIIQSPDPTKDMLNGLLTIFIKDNRLFGMGMIFLCLTICLHIVNLTLTSHSDQRISLYQKL